MVIAVHGSDRDTAGLLGGFDALGDTVTLLVPEFPQVMGGQDIADDYKFLVGNGVNYLDLLDDMRRQGLHISSAFRVAPSSCTATRYFAGRASRGLSQLRQEA